MLHDITLNHFGKGIKKISATGLLYSSIVGEKVKYLNEDGFYTNFGIGIMKTTADTKKYIENVFLALGNTWDYMLSIEQLKIYKNYLCQYYSQDLIHEFESAVDMNKATLSRNQCFDIKSFYAVYELLESLKYKRNIFIYGCGNYGRKLYKFLTEGGIEIQGYVVSDNQAKPSVNARVEYISDVKDRQSTLVLAMSTEHQKEIYKDTILYDWICINEYVQVWLGDKFYCV